MNKLCFNFIVLLLSLLAAGCNSGRRPALSAADLLEGFEADGPVDNSALARSPEAEEAAHVFEGRLVLSGQEQAGNLRIVGEEREVNEAAYYLPPFDFALVQHGRYLVPVQRALIITDHPTWNLILEPGQVWHDESDGSDYSRASLPFALVWKGSNAVFNGLLTFLFNEDSVSNVWYQVTQETTISLKADMWGLLAAEYRPGQVAGANEIRAAFDREIAGRMPSKPIEQLADDYPGVDAAAFGQGVTPEFMTWYGLVVDGTNYVGGCQTRTGHYPYCEGMRAPSYSTAKSAFVSAAVMGLAQMVDPQVPDLLIKDYVPEAAASPGDWSQVTFNDTLDMATGNFSSSGFMVDEEMWDTDPFWLETYYDELIAAAFDWPHSAPAGSQWVYRTSDTFILTQALTNYLQASRGKKADIFQYVVDELYRPLGIGPGALATLRTEDNNWQGRPVGGYGLWWVPDDLAKISDWLNADGGAVDGRQLLEPDLLAAALQRDAADRGVAIDGRRRYNNAFWATRYGSDDGFDCELWVAQMQGYSGIVVALFPNGISYYYASDGREFTWEAALRESDKMRPLCG